MNNGCSISMRILAGFSFWNPAHWGVYYRNIMPPKVSQWSWINRTGQYSPIKTSLMQALVLRSGWKYRITCTHWNVSLRNIITRTKSVTAHPVVPMLKITPPPSWKHWDTFHPTRRYPTWGPFKMMTDYCLCGGNNQNVSKLLTSYQYASKGPRLFLSNEFTSNVFFHPWTKSRFPQITWKCYRPHMHSSPGCMGSGRVDKVGGVAAILAPRNSTNRRL